MAKVFQSPIDLAVDSSAWTLTGAPSKPEAVDDPNGQPDDGTSYLQCTTTGAGVEQIEFAFPPMPEAVSIVQVTIHIRSEEQSGVANHAPFVRSGGTQFDGAGISLPVGVYTDHSDQWTTDPGTGLPWSKAGVDASTAGVVQQAAAAVARLTQIIREVEFVPFAVKVGAAREVASRELRMFRRPLPLVEITGPLAWADVELGTDLALTHTAYPSPDGLGARSKEWQRASIRVLEQSIDLDNWQVALKGLDLRHLLCRFWDTMRSEERATGASPGPARLDPGVLRAFSRGSLAWVRNGAAAAQGQVQLIEVGADVEKLEGVLGGLFEEDRENRILNSAFISGVSTNWTPTGNVAVDTSVLLFEGSVTPQSARFARTGTNNERLAAAAIAYSGGQVLTLSGWHLDDSGAAMGWSAQRSTDSWWWNDSTQAWQAGAVVNTFPVRSDWEMDQSNPIVLAAGAQSITITFYAETASGQVAHLGVAQLEEGRYATSPIVTEGSAVTRGPDTLRVENDGEGVWLPGQGTFRATFRPGFSRDPDILEDNVLINITNEGDGDTYDRLFYRNSTGQFRFERYLGGPVFVATFQIDVVRGVEYHVVGRAVGESGELDLAAHTLSVFVDGVRGTDAVASGPSNAGGWLDIGSKRGIEQSSWAGGHLSDVSVSPFVLHDSEILDWRG